MSTITFDTLAYAKRLKGAGFTEEQAEAQKEMLSEVLGSLTKIIVPNWMYKLCPQRVDIDEILPYFWMT